MIIYFLSMMWICSRSSKCPARNRLRTEDKDRDIIIPASSTEYRTDRRTYYQLPLYLELGNVERGTEGQTGARQATMADTTLAGRFHRLNCLQSVKLSTCKSKHL